MSDRWCRFFGHSWYGVEGSILKCQRCGLIHDEDAAPTPTNTGPTDG